MERIAVCIAMYEDKQHESNRVAKLSKRTEQRESGERERKGKRLRKHTMKMVP